MSFQTNSFPTNKEFYDKVNSKFSVAFYHSEEWVCPYKKCKTSGYNRYLKNLKDEEYNKASDEQRVIIEFKKSIFLLEKKLQGSYKNNRLITICIYENKNMGGSKKDSLGQPIENVRWCMLELKLGPTPFVRTVNPYFVTEQPAMAAILNELMEAWEETIMNYKYLQQF